VGEGYLEKAVRGQTPSCHQNSGDVIWSVSIELTELTAAPPVELVGLLAMIPSSFNSRQQRVSHIPFVPETADTHCCVLIPFANSTLLCTQWVLSVCAESRVLGITCGSLRANLV